jgi:hypothetical protein
MNGDGLGEASPAYVTAMTGNRAIEKPVVGSLVVVAWAGNGARVPRVAAALHMVRSLRDGHVRVGGVRKHNHSLLCSNISTVKCHMVQGMFI